MNSIQYGEILNVDYHRAHLLIFALNKAPTIQKAAELLGISNRIIYDWMHNFDVDFNAHTDTYFLKPSFYDFYNKYVTNKI